MRERLLNVAAVLAAWAGTLKLCCIAPALFSVTGLAGTAAAVYVTRWVSPGLAVVSAALLARSFYALYVRKSGSRTSEVATWVSAFSVAGFWVYRILSS
jgi:hypothetical protein